MTYACLDFLNSDWHDWRGSGLTEDHLDKPEWLKAFSARWGLAVEGRPDPAARDALVALRTLLRRAVDTLAAGRQMSTADLAELNKVIATWVPRHHLAPTKHGYRFELVPPAEDWSWVRAELAMSFAQLLVDGDPRRIKVCDNPDCRWVYYDESRNRTRRWCEDTCGNLLKVRRFRARQKAARPGGGGPAS